MVHKDTDQESVLKVGIDERLPVGENLLYGAQHILALTGIWILPVLLGLALDLDRPVTAYIISACYVTSGLVTILQATFLLRLPVVQGPTAAFFAAILQVGKTIGLAAAYGSLTIAAIVWALLSIPIRRLSVISRIAPLFTSPLVYGSLIVIIGAQLTNIGLSNWLGLPGTPGFGWTNLLFGLVAILVTFGCMIFGRGLILRGAVLWGVIVGSIIYGLFMPMDLSGVGTAGWFGLPQIYPFGFAFNWTAFAVMMVAFLPAFSESLSFYRVLARWGNQSMSPVRMSGGVFGDSIACAIGSIFGGMATTSYPENIAIIRISGVGSRFVALAAGIIAIIVGLIPKVGMTMASLPLPVLSATATLLFGIIAMSGVQMLAQVNWDNMNLAIAGIAFSVALGSLFLPPEFTETLSPTLSILVTEPMVIGAILLVVLNGIGNLVIRPMLENRQKLQEPGLTTGL